METIGWITASVVAVVMFALGYFLGRRVADDAQCEKSVGMLVIDATDKENPELFTQLYETPDTIGKHKHVIFEVFYKSQK